MKTNGTSIGTQLTTLVAFDGGTMGDEPVASLVQDSKGKF